MAEGEGAAQVAAPPLDLSDALALADWRRTVAALYAEVRRQAVGRPEVAHGHWCRARERLYRKHPQSPIPAPLRDRFAARHFAYDPALRFDAAVVADDTVRAAAPSGLHRLGRVHLEFPDGARGLTLFWMAGYADGPFLPFGDATNGHETYGGGRYLLDGPKGADLGAGRADGRLILDFNFAYQPSCAFDARWACPLPPPENRLDIAVRAGERLR